MKSRSPLTLTISLAILAATALPSVAQSARLPTDAEMQELIKQLRSFAGSTPGDARRIYSKDRRTRTQIQQITSFVKAWSQIQPETAPFLGEWTAIEESKSIYPSNIKGRVCIIDTFIPSDRDIGFIFSQGTVSQGKIKTESDILINQGNYLGAAFIHDNKPRIYEYAWPKPLKTPAELMRHIPQNNPQRDRIIERFQKAGCTASLPNRR
ncbi:MAG: hypothetical protein MUE44_25895 [Oscillatoriaceae cyanobacterium Prado104]|jgi:hypothetical protein|nr:hypothetical protein [Oscillatoriaceae cyanobacterium Prado104]